ncbi:MAG TPA: arylamine N-acetyltransferase [Polyangiaceae bacterium]|jgi:N-hydroxyarylamine O-acetyltransferase
MADGPAASIDLDAYLDRIAWKGERSPTFATMASVLRAHMAAIPFENLDVLLGRGVRLDLEGLQAKLVHARRGGYCFEHCTLLAAALEQLGFQPARHAARVVLFSPRTAAPRTHMFLTVALPEGTFVLDPGFGGLAARVPVPLAEDRKAMVDHETHWMARDGGLWVLHVDVADRKGGEAWVSTMEEENAVDFELGNHYTATHPASPFRKLLMLRMLTADGRVTVMNRDATVWKNGTPRTWQLADRAELRGLLVGHFGFDLPEVESLRVPAAPEWA